MSVIPYLLILSLFLAGGFLAAFAWALRRGQFDDVSTPAWRILHEDEPDPEKDHAAM